MNAKAKIVLPVIVLLLAASALLFVIHKSHERKRDIKTMVKTKEGFAKQLTDSYSCYSSINGNEVKHGLYRTRLKNLYQDIIISEGCYIDGIKSGLWIERASFPNHEAFVFYVNDKPVTIKIFIKGKGISSCILENGEPFSGTFWCMRTGLDSQGGSDIRECHIATYKGGKIVKAQECDLYGNILKEGNSIAGKALSECLDEDELKILKDLNELWAKEQKETEQTKEFERKSVKNDAIPQK